MAYKTRQACKYQRKSKTEGTKQTSQIEEEKGGDTTRARQREKQEACEEKGQES